MGRVIMSGIVPQLTVPSAGTPISEFAVGSTVKLNINGASKDFLIVHQGLPSSMYDSSCNGTWLLMNDIYEKRQWYSANNSYKDSTIHSYLNSTFLALFDSDIQSAIKEVKIPYVNGTGSGGSVASGANGLSAQIFLLSGYELGWTQSNHSSYLPIDGACLSYFNGAASVDSKRIGYLNGTATNWWQRSPYTSNTQAVLIAYMNGGPGSGTCSDTFGIRPALILPSTALVKDDGTVKGAA